MIKLILDLIAMRNTLSDAPIVNFPHSNPTIYHDFFFGKCAHNV